MKAYICPPLGSCNAKPFRWAVQDPARATAMSINQECSKLQNSALFGEKFSLYDSTSSLFTPGAIY